jgi:hypothetical protein
VLSAPPLCSRSQSQGEAQGGDSRENLCLPSQQQ